MSNLPAGRYPISNKALNVKTLNFIHLRLCHLNLDIYLTLDIGNLSLISFLLEALTTFKSLLQLTLFISTVGTSYSHSNW